LEAQIASFFAFGFVATKGHWWVFGVIDMKLVSSLAMLALAMPAAAQPGASETSVRAAKVQWDKQPSDMDLKSVIPLDAKSLAAPGFTQLICALAADGTLTDCAIQIERPGGHELGLAAYRSSQFYRAKMTDPLAAKVAVGRVFVEVPQEWKP